MTSEWVRLKWFHRLLGKAIEEVEREGDLNANLALNAAEQAAAMEPTREDLQAMGLVASTAGLEAALSQLDAARQRNLREIVRRVRGLPIGKRLSLSGMSLSLED